jgi:hypothetical protein
MQHWLNNLQCSSAVVEFTSSTPSAVGIRCRLAEKNSGGPLRAIGLRAKRWLQTKQKATVECERGLSGMGWTQLTAEDGRPYFYNESTGVAQIY